MWIKRREMVRETAEKAEKAKNMNIVIK